MKRTIQMVLTSAWAGCNAGYGLNGSQHLRATNKNVALIYSVTINEKTTKDCKDPYIGKLRHFVFIFDNC